MEKTLKRYSNPTVNDIKTINKNISSSMQKKYICDINISNSVVKRLYYAFRTRDVTRDELLTWVNFVLFNENYVIEDEETLNILHLLESLDEHTVGEESIVEQIDGILNDK